MPLSSASKSWESRASCAREGNVEVEAAMCHEGQGVKISPIFFSGGFGVDSDGWKDGLVVNCSHMKKSADGAGGASGAAGLQPVTPS